MQPSSNALLTGVQKHCDIESYIESEHSNISLPDEHGSCRVNTDCTQRAAPYCSGFGYCTQITQYGQGGCSPCHRR